MIEVQEIKNSPRYILSSIAEDIFPLVGLCTAGVLYIPSLPHLWGLVAAFGVLIVSLTLVCQGAYVIFVPRLILTNDRLQYSDGFIVKRSHTLSWQDVTAVNVAQPWTRKFVGLHEVTITASGSKSAEITLEALTAKDATALVALWKSTTSAKVDAMALTASSGSSRRSASDGKVDEPQPVLEPKRTVYRASSWEIASTALAHLTVAGTLAMALFEPIQRALGGQFERGDRWDAGFSHTLLATIVATAALLPVYSMVRFWSAGLYEERNGHLSYSYGLFDTIEQTFEREGVRGVQVRQNPIEALLGVRRVALRISLPQGASRKVILPALQPEGVETILGLLGENPLGVLNRRPSQKLLTAWSVAVVSLIMVLVLTHPLPRAWQMLTAGLFLFLFVKVWRMVTCSFFDPGRHSRFVLWRSYSFAESIDLVRREDVAGSIKYSVGDATGGVERTDCYPNAKLSFWRRVAA